MRSVFWTTFAIALLALWISASFAERRAPTEIERRMADAGAWIESRTTMRWDGSLPKVRFVEPERLMVEMYGRSALREAERTGNALAPILAVYDPRREEMILPSTFDVERDSYMLVHEMVHHMQKRNGILSDCPGLNEPVAVALHREWLRLHGFPVVDGVNGPNDLYVKILVMDCLSAGHKKVADVLR